MSNLDKYRETYAEWLLIERKYQAMNKELTELHNKRMSLYTALSSLAIELDPKELAVVHIEQFGMN